MRKRTIAGLLLVAGIWWWRGGEAPSVERTQPAQTAVLADGFAILIGPRDIHDSRHVYEFDRGGTRQNEMPLRLDRKVRFVGTRAGSAVGWHDGKKLVLGILDSDGNPGDLSTWGRNVRELCDGAATNEHRFGIGWLEADGRVWMVHGPMNRLAGEPIEAFELAPAKASWCGIAAAEQNIALLWREGGRLLMNFCTRKGCTSLVVKVPIDTKDTLLGYGCVRDSCLFATRDRQGTTKLHRVTEKGRAIVKTLEHATTETAVSIVGAGTRAFAIAYVAKDGRATIQRVTVDGSFSNVSHFEAKQAPSLAWAADTLLVALPSGKASVLKLPR